VEKERLLAFTDGVIAVIITIMVLEMKVSQDASLGALASVIPVFLSYVLSFVYVAIYWNNHHHFFHLVRHVNGVMLWANLNLLFWLSLIPFVTGWMGENHFAPVPTALYGVALLMPALAWYGLQLVIIRTQGNDSPLARDRPRPQGQGFAGSLYRRHYARIRRCADRRCNLSARSLAVVDPGPAYRKSGPPPLIARARPEAISAYAEHRPTDFFPGIALLNHRDYGFDFIDLLGPPSAWRSTSG
jgi:uncharacterized membrane protein